MTESHGFMIYLGKLQEVLAKILKEFLFITKTAE